jgi:hypothetical protein
MPGYSTTVISFDDGVYPYKDEGKRYFVMKGARKVVASRYAWYNSNTYGGYVEAVVMRYLRRKYNMKPLREKDIVWKDGWVQHQHIENEDKIGGIIQEMCNRYGIHRNTQNAISKNIFNALCKGY